MEQPTDIDLRLRAIDQMTPAEGFNVVGVDDYEDPGDELYLVGHTATMEEAQALVDQRKRANPQEVLHIYGQKGA